MPQLDITSYYPQFVWFLGTFFFFYFSLVYWYLPRIATLFEIRRSKKSSLSDHEVQGSLQAWTNTIQDQYMQMYLPPLSKVKSSLTQATTLSQECVNSAYLSYISQAPYVKTYLRSLQIYCIYSFITRFFLMCTLSWKSQAEQYKGKELESHLQYFLVKKMSDGFVKKMSIKRPMPFDRKTVVHSPLDNDKEKEEYCVAKMSDGK